VINLFEQVAATAIQDGQVAEKYLEDLREEE